MCWCFICKKNKYNNCKLEKANQTENKLTTVCLAAEDQDRHNASRQSPCPTSCTLAHGCHSAAPPEHPAQPAPEDPLDGKVVFWCLSPLSHCLILVQQHYHKHSVFYSRSTRAPSTHQRVWAESRALGTCTTPRPRKRNAPFSKVHFCLLIQSFYSRVTDLAHTTLVHLPKEFLRPTPNDRSGWFGLFTQKTFIAGAWDVPTQTPTSPLTFIVLSLTFLHTKSTAPPPILFSLIRYKEQGRTVWS